MPKELTIEEKRVRSDKGRPYYAANRDARLAYARAYSAERQAAGEVTARIVREARIKAQTPEVAHHPLCRLVMAVLWDTAALYEDIAGERFDLDHIVPLCQGGANATWNLRPLEAKANLSRRKSLA